MSDINYNGRLTDMCHPLEYLQSPRSENKFKKKSYGNTSSVLPSRGPVVGGDTFSRLLVAPIIGPEKKVAMSPSSTTVDEAWHDFSRVSVSWLIRAG